jgi:outer membrane receptor protein involved in Fe transport
MKTKIFSAICLAMICFCSYAIEPTDKDVNSYTVSGTVIDNVTQKPVEYANVVLFNKKDSSMVTGTVTPSDGKFMLKDLKEGEYYLLVNFIGYKKKYIYDLSLTKANNNLKLGIILLEQTSTQLNEVNVTAEKSDVEYKIDKKVVNVSQNLNSVGGTAIDALQNVPGVTVDNSDNVSLRGSQNFTVLVDGKPTVLSGSEALKQIPASSIEKIEVITNPSAKYDAEGTSGIINILMKKGSNVGFNGVINASAGYKDKYTGDFLFNLKREKINYFAGLNYRNVYNVSYTDTYKETTTRPDTTDYLFSELVREGVYKNNIGKAGFDYNINDKNALNFSVQGGNVHFVGDNVIKYHEWTSLPSSDIYTLNKDRMDVKGYFYTGNLGYQKKFSKPGHELNSLLFYSNWTGTRDDINNEYQTNSNWDISDYNVIKFRRYNEEERSEMRLKIDYTLPLDSLYKLETGFQSSFRPVSSSNIFENYDLSFNTWIADESQRDNYDYSNDVYALYSTFSGQFKKFEYQLGLRGEYNARLLTQNVMNKEYSLKKLDFFPSFSVSRQFKKENQLQFSYSRRINRPHEQLLNPFPFYSDKYFSMRGNPNLLPEYINSFELNYMKRYKKLNYSVETYFRQNNNAFNQMIHVDENGLFYTDFENIDQTNFYGVDLSGNIDVAKWFSIAPSISAFGYQYKSDNITYDVPKLPVSFQGRSSFTFKINKTTRIQLNGYANAPFYDVQGWQDWFYTAGMSVRKDFLKSFTAVLNMRNPFNIYQYNSKNQVNELYNTFHIWSESPVVMLSITYKINNYKPSQSREETIDLNVN